MYHLHIGVSEVSWFHLYWFIVLFHISVEYLAHIDLKAALKLDLYDKNNLQNYLKIRILSETSILYLIRLASFILIVGLHM